MSKFNREANTSYYDEMFTKERPIDEDEEDVIEIINPKTGNRDRWADKHRKDKDYRNKYGNDDDRGWN